jgi:catechol 2,3-dioxygenase-like lactoylglutathione lyase family enzyme
MGVKTIPQLPTDDLDVTSNFYRALGFAERARWPNQYLILDREGLELHFWFAGVIDPLKNESSCYVRFDDASEARDLYDQWAPLDVEGKDLRSPTETDYGLLEFALIDPHGNLVRVGGSIETNS